MMNNLNTPGAPEVEGPFEMFPDAGAYFTNRSWSPRFKGSFRQRSKVLLLNASQGCIFCMLLKSLQDELPADFEFSIFVESAWKWSTVTVTAKEEEDRDRSGYFRVYETVDSSQLACFDPDCENLQVSEKNDFLQHGSSIPQQLARDGQILRALIDDCTANHIECKQQERLARPSMLLHVSGTSALPTVRLVKVSELEVAPIRYVCLSYCWGGEQRSMTTTSRLNTYLNGINTATIPKTILDAIRVTISMGYQYIWVDSFCIVQDSGPDKITELGRMTSIYSGAACTLCITSAKSVNEGFLEEAHQDSPEDQSIHTWYADIREASNSRTAVILEIRSDFSSYDVFESPILERGWTFQEALLSTHLVMFFSHGQRPALRCPKRTIQSNGGRVSQYPKPLTSLRVLELNVENKKQKERQYETMLAKSEQWVTVVKNLSQRSFTYQLDKLPAIMGILPEWEAMFELGSYWAGLWSKMLAKGLMWQAQRRFSTRAACETYVAPSWSWASRDHPVEYQSLQEIDSDDGARSFEVISCQVIPVHEELPNGMIKSARLTIKCAAVLVEIGTSDSEGRFLLCEPGYRRDVWIVFDDSPRSQDTRKTWLLHINDQQPYNNSNPIGIVVAEVDMADVDGAKLYKRVGYFALHWSGGFGDFPVRTFTII